MRWNEWIEPRRHNVFPENPSVPFVNVESQGTGRDGSCWVVAKGEYPFALKIMRTRNAADTNQASTARAETEASRWQRL